MFKSRSKELSKLSGLLNHLEQAILVEKPGGEILYANNSFCELFKLGVSPEKIIGQASKLVYDRIGKQIAGPATGLLEIGCAIEAKEKKKGVILKLKDGVSLSTDIIPIIDEKATIGTSMVVFTDVTSVLKMESVPIPQQDNFFHDILNHIPFDIAVLDLNQNYLFVNWNIGHPKTNRSWMIGKTDENLVAKGLLTSDEALTRRAYFLKAVNSKTPVEFQETQVVNNIDTKHFLRGYYPIINQEKEVAQVIKIGIDITARVKTEQQLTTAKLRAEKNMRAKDTFLAKVSHELRTPMNGLIGILEVIKKTTLTSQQEHYIDVLQRSSQNLLKIVNDVLDIEKMASGKFEPENIIFSLTDKVSLLRDVYSAQALQKNLTFSLKIFEPLPAYFIGDPIRISQVIGNLLSNAIKFTREGGIELQVKQIQSSFDKSTIECKVIDTGLGFSPELSDTIFEPFSQLNIRMNTIEKGSGLGLSICRDIAELLDGELVATSEPGVGSTFTFTFPLVISSVAPISLDEAVEKKELELLVGKRVLLAEDMELNKIVMKELLSDIQIQLDMADNGEEAVHLSEVNKYDFILMDIKMPVMDGIEATKLIRASGNLNQYTPIIAISANGFEKDRKSYLEAGMNDVLVKPITTSMLLRSFAGKVQADNLPNSVRSDVAETEKPNEISIDLTYLLRVGGNKKEFVPLMLRSFCTSAEEILIQLDESIERSDWEKTALLIHKIKFSLGVLGIKSLNTQVEWLETNARQIVQAEKQQYLIQVIAMKSVVVSLIEEAKQLMKMYDA